MKNVSMKIYRFVSKNNICHSEINSLLGGYDLEYHKVIPLDRSGGKIPFLFVFIFSNISRSEVQKQFESLVQLIKNFYEVESEL